MHCDFLKRPSDFSLNIEAYDGTQSSIKHGVLQPGKYVQAPFCEAMAHYICCKWLNREEMLAVIKLFHAAESDNWNRFHTAQKGQPDTFVRLHLLDRFANFTYRYQRKLKIGFHGTADELKQLWVSTEGLSMLPSVAKDEVFKEEGAFHEVHTHRIVYPTGGTAKVSETYRNI